MTADIALNIIAAALSVVSIIIIYVMFALQTWFERVASLFDHAVGLSLSTVPSSFERKDALNRLIEQRRRFPWLQVLTLGVANSLVAATGMVAGFEARNELSLWYSLTPLAVLLAAYASSTLTIWTRGRADIREAIDYLGLEVLSAHEAGADSSENQGVV